MGWKEDQAVREWEEGQKRIKIWQAASQEPPSPEGMIRCMNCYAIMSCGTYCECLRAVGLSIRLKAKKALAPAVKTEKKKRNQSAKKKEQYRNQRRLFL